MLSMVVSPPPGTLVQPSSRVFNQRLVLLARGPTHAVHFSDVSQSLEVGHGGTVDAALFPKLIVILKPENTFCGVSVANHR
jgi:hypothetical protein